MTSEAEVQKQCLDLLGSDWRVSLVGRFNSGRKGHIVFQKLIGIEKMPDIAGMLTDGTFFAFECKKPDWTGPKGEREQKQAETLQHIENNCGVAAFISDPIQAKWSIDGHYQTVTYGV